MKRNKGEYSSRSFAFLFSRIFDFETFELFIFIALFPHDPNELSDNDPNFEAAFDLKLNLSGFDLPFTIGYECQIFI